MNTSKFEEKFLSFKEAHNKIFELCMKFVSVFDQKDKDQKVKVYQPTISDSRLRIRVSDQFSLVLDFHVTPHWSGRGYMCTEPNGNISICQNGSSHGVGSNTFYTTYKYVGGCRLNENSNVDEILKQLLTNCIEKNKDFGISTYGKPNETIKKFLSAN